MILFLLTLVLEVVSLIVFIDLWLANNKKVHVYTPLMQLISEKQRRVYQTMYYNSFKRDSFCVLDKIPVSGFYFSTWMTGLLALSIPINLLSGQPTTFVLWLNGFL